MAKIIITMDGKEYPCRPTMGAMVRFERETGRDISESKGVSDMVMYLYCCCASACATDGKEFPYSFLDFADRVDPETMNNWKKAVDDKSADEDGGEEKKS